MTDAELTILSILEEGSRHGHEVQQMIRDRGLREWIAVGFSSVYYVLNKLERQQLITSSLRNDGRGPARKLYRLSDAGRGILQTAIVDLIRQPVGLGTGFELGLANLHVLDARQVYRALVDHRDTLKYQLMAVERAWASNETTQDNPLYALYTHSITRMQAEVTWLEDFLATWVARYPDSKGELSQAEKDTLDPHRAQTLISRRPTPDPVKMLQKLKRPKPADINPPDDPQA